MMTTLDSAGLRADGGKDWAVLVRNFNARGPGDGQDPYLTEKVTATYVYLDGGALVFRDEDGALVKAYGPGGWLEVDRA